MECPASLPNEAKSWSVKDLWFPMQKTWNEPFIRSSLPRTIASRILSTPLNDLITEDRLIWKAIVLMGVILLKQLIR